MEVQFTLYEGFLIADYQEDKVKAYRSREFYAGNTTSYETSSPANVKLMIDEASDHGDFTEAEYSVVMQLLGRVDSSLPDEGIEKAAAYIAGLVVGREDVDSPEHLVWVHLEEQYRESYRRRARRVIELARI